MNKVLAILFVFLVSASVSYGQRDTTRLPNRAEYLKNITWKTTTIDMGKVIKGTPIYATFEFANTGKTPVYISNVQTPAAGTNASWTQISVEPGCTGLVKITYDAGYPGPFNKTGFVTFNTGQTFVMNMKGQVVEKEVL